MKYLGIDYGTKRIGLALSDEDGVLAFPHKVIQNKSRANTEIIQIAKSEKIEKIVVGESLDYKNQPNQVMKNIEKFGKELNALTGIEVLYEPEYLTSAQARRAPGAGTRVDASAAALILQYYLDSHV